jgi:hypothetical protein
MPAISVKGKSITVHSAAEAVDRCLISLARLLDLAEANFIPHYRIDNGEPLFVLSELRRWIDENALDRNEGNRLPTEIIIHRNNSSLPTPRSIPETLHLIPNLRELKSVSDLMSARCGIYFLLLAEKLVYIGQSKNVATRVGSHAKEKHFNRVLYLAWPSFDLDRVEGALIRAFAPELNGRVYGDILSAPGDGSEDEAVLKELRIELCKQNDDSKAA